MAKNSMPQHSHQTRSDSNLIRLGLKSSSSHSQQPNPASAIGEMATSSRASLETDMPVSTPSSWSLTPSVIRLQASDPNTQVISLRNNLNRRSLPFEVRFRSDFLSVEPHRGVLDPLGTVDLHVHSISSSPHEPWSGTITVWCNQFNRDVHVVFEPVTLQRSNNLKPPYDTSTPHHRTNNDDFEQDSLEPGAIASHDLEANSTMLSLDSIMPLTPHLALQLTPSVSRILNSDSMVFTPSLTTVSKLPAQVTPDTASSSTIESSVTFFKTSLENLS